MPKQDAARAPGAGASTAEVFAGGGELGRLMTAMDWSATALGPVEQWPRALVTAVRIILTSRQPMFVWWGDELINLYNDAYRSILGGKHPRALGEPALVVWREIWDQVGPRAESAMSRTRARTTSRCSSSWSGTDTPRRPTTPSPIPRPQRRGRDRRDLLRQHR
jgi:hypothetical protein